MAILATHTTGFNMAQTETEDLMEFSTEGDHNLHRDDEIDIDIDVEGAVMDHTHEDEDMGEEELGEYDDDMLDEEAFAENGGDEIIEDVDDYGPNSASHPIVDDEDLIDAEEHDIQQTQSYLEDNQMTAEDVHAGSHQRPQSEQISDPLKEHGASPSSGNKLWHPEEPMEPPELAQGAVDYVIKDKDISKVPDIVPEASESEPFSNQKADEKPEEFTFSDHVHNGHDFDDNLEDDEYSENHLDVLKDQHAQAVPEEGPFASGQIELTPSHKLDVATDDQALYTGEEEDALHSTVVSNAHANDTAPEQDDAEDQFPHNIFVHYQGAEMFLFPPQNGDDESQTYLLAESAVANETIQTLLQSCRLVLGESIDESEDLELRIPTLGLVFEQAATISSTVSLAHIVGVYLQLQQNDGHETPGALYVVLETRQKVSDRLQSLYSAISEGRGLSKVQISTPVTLSPRPDVFDNDNNEEYEDRLLNPEAEIAERETLGVTSEKDATRPRTPTNTNLIQPDDDGNDMVEVKSPVHTHKDASIIRDENGDKTTNAPLFLAVYEEEDHEGVQSAEAVQPNWQDQEEDSHSTSTLQEVAAPTSESHIAHQGASSQSLYHFVDQDLGSGLATGQEAKAEDVLKAIEVQSAAPVEPLDDTDSLDQGNHQILDTNPQSPSDGHDKGNAPGNVSRPAHYSMPDSDGFPLPLDEVHGDPDEFEESLDLLAPATLEGLDRGILRPEEIVHTEARTDEDNDFLEGVASNPEDEITFEDEDHFEDQIEDKTEEYLEDQIQDNCEDRHEDGDDNAIDKSVDKSTDDPFGYQFDDEFDDQLDDCVVGEESYDPITSKPKISAQDVAPSPGSLKRPRLAEDEVDLFKTPSSESKRSRSD